MTTRALGATGRPATGATRRAASRWTTLLLLAYGFNAAVGTNLEYPEYYLVSGISLIDVFALVDLFRILRRDRWALIISRDRLELWHALFVVALAGWLMLSTIVNGYRFEFFLADLLPATKLLYFVCLTYLFQSYVRRYGVKWLINGFVLGVLLLVGMDLRTAGESVMGVPILSNPNVLGALLGIGTWFAAVSRLSERGLVVNGAATALLAALSVTTFSKGTWLMCAGGVGLFVLSVVAGRVRFNVTRRRKIAAALAFGLVAFVTVRVVLANYDLVVNMFAFKLLTTEVSGSTTIRSTLVQAAWRAALDNPVVGLGYRNFSEVRRLYPDLVLPPLGRFDNAHNLFAQVLAVGGFPAGILLGLAFLLPLLAFWTGVRPWVRHFPLRAAALLLTLVVWATYGAVQLQLLAQPPFWLFCGMAFAFRHAAQVRASALPPGAH